MTAKHTIAFIGVGNMGSRMARRLINFGHTVQVYDVNAGAVEELVSAGAAAASSPAEAARGAEFIFTSVPNPAVLDSVYRGAHGVLSTAETDAIAIDFSTIDPATARSIAGECAAVGVRFLDAPVSRGVPAAETGTLSIMVGGTPETVAAALPVLEQLGSAITHVGEVGTGQLVKLCNNMLAAMMTAALGEVLVAGVNAGLSMDTLYDVLHASAADSHILSAYFPRVVFGPERPTNFSLDFMVKDVDLFLRAMGDGEVPLLLSAVTRQLYRICQGQGLGSRDSTAVVEFYEQLAGVRLQMKEKTA
jgi:3-hydroxyisobutyrate dehydrogenase